MQYPILPIPWPPRDEISTADTGFREGGRGQTSHSDSQLPVNRRHLRVATLTADDAHHRYLLSRLAARFHVVAAFVEPAAEQRKALFGRRLWRSWFWSGLHTIRRRILGLDRFRRRYFAHTPVDPPQQPRVVRSINDPEVNETLCLANPDFVIVMGTSIIRELPPRLAINIHGGYLPYYRGNNCFFFAMLHGEFDRVGSTIHLVDNGIDTGEIIEVVAPAVSPTDTPEMAYCRAEHEAIERLVCLLAAVEGGGQLPRHPPAGPGKLYRNRDRKLRHEVMFWSRWAVRWWSARGSQSAGSSKARILIVGPGAVGRGIAAACIEGGVRPDIVVSDGRLRRGFSWSGLGSRPGFASPSDFNTYIGIESVPLYRRYDHIVVCTKYGDAEPVLRDIAARGFVGLTTAVTLTQNGWGLDELAAKILSPEQVFHARLLTGFALENGVAVVGARVADTHIGNVFGRSAEPVQSLAAILTQGGLLTQVVDTETICKDLAAKLLFNSAVNALSAVLRVRIGALGSVPFARVLVDQVIRECFAVLLAAGLKLPWASVESYLAEFYQHLLPLAAKHESSLGQDLRRGHKTEIGWINGKICDLAKIHDIPVPFNGTLLLIVNAMEARDSGAGLVAMSPAA